MTDPVGKRLFDAAENGHTSEVSSLLRDYPEINVNWANPGSHQWTPLHNASFFGFVEVVKLLLVNPSINVNVKHKFGETPFYIWL